MVCQGAKCRYVQRQCFSTVRSSLAASVPCRKVCRLRRFAWGRPGTSSRVAERVCHTTSGTVPPRYGSAVSSPACYSSTPCVLSALCAVLAALRAVLGSKATKCSGQAGHSRPHPLSAVGADCAGHPSFVADASLLHQIRAVRHRLRGSARIKGVGLCFYSTGSACSRTPSYPARRSLLRSQW